MQIALRKFDPASIDDTRNILVIGKRGTGKSILVRDLMWHHRKIAAGICCSGTEEGNGFYGTFVPDSFVFSEFDKSAIERLVTRQRALRKKGVKDPAFLVLDDCMYDRRFLKEKIMRNLFYNGRHWAIFMIMTSQYMLDLSPDLRTNVDYVFILREPIRANRERLWKAFGGIFPTFDQFNAVMDAVTSNFGALVIDNTSKSNNVEDVAFWFKANPNRNFKMGSAAFWRYHHARYDPNHDGPTPEEQSAKKNTVKVLKKK